MNCISSTYVLFLVLLAVATARPLGSERTLTGAGGVTEFPGKLPTLPPSASGKNCSPFNTVSTPGCPAMGNVGNPDHGKHWFAGATIEGTSACPDTTELIDGVCVMRITCDDIVLSRGQAALMPAGYKGFNWSNMAVYNPAGTTASGYINGMISSSNVGVAMPALTTEMTAVGFTFSMISLQATAAWNDGMTVVFTGYAAGVEKATQIVILNASGPTLVIFGAGWEGLDNLTIEASGGTHVSTYTETGNNVALDDIMVA